MANVWLPQRLKVLAPCMTVTGTVRAIRHEEDGDYHINVEPDPAYAGLLNDRNRTAQHGALVVEIVPADQAGCTPGRPPRPPDGRRTFGRCTGANLTPPPLGAHVSLTGAYVLDRPHGWNEIHPVWSIAAR